jgi:hypothetical protein
MTIGDFTAGVSFSSNNLHERSVTIAVVSNIVIDPTLSMGSRGYIEPPVFGKIPAVFTERKETI